jgi:hypothetical protein
MTSSAKVAPDAPFVHLKVSTADLAMLTEEMKTLHQNPDEYWYAMGSRLQKILYERLYRTGNYRSFSDYCARGVGYSRQHVYKLIKVVKFIDELWAQAKTAEQCMVVHRLFRLGFTKLYMLHSLPASTLEHLLNKGVECMVGEGQPITIISLEATTIGQLKRALGYKTDNTKKPSTAGTRLAATNALTTLIGEQTKTLLRFVEQCRNEMDNREDFAEILGTIEQYASAIVYSIGTMAGGEAA